MFKFILYFTADLGPKFRSTHIRELSNPKILYTLIRNGNIVNIYDVNIQAYKNIKNKNNKALNNS